MNKLWISLLAFFITLLFDAGVLYLTLLAGFRNHSKNQAADSSFEAAAGVLLVFLALGSVLVIYYLKTSHKALASGIVLGLLPILGLTVFVLWALLIH